MNKISVLFVPAGSGMAVSAIKSIVGKDYIKIHALDTDPLAPGLYLAHKGYLIPNFSSERFLPNLEKLILKEDIKVIFPALDTILAYFAEKQNYLQSKFGVKVIISDLQTIQITRDKWLTYQHLKDKIPLPDSWIDLNQVPKKFPLFIKPRRGSGSVNAIKLNNEKELNFFFDYIEDPIIQEYLPGEECTVDCITNDKGKLVAVLPRLRIQSKAGISVKGKMVFSPEIIDIAEKINSTFMFRGPFFFQIKKDANGIYRLTEINARLSGSMIFSIKSSINIVEYAIRDSLGLSLPNINENIMKAGYAYSFEFFSRYWEELYLRSSDIENNLDRNYL